MISGMGPSSYEYITEVNLIGDKITCLNITGMDARIRNCAVVTRERTLSEGTVHSIRTRNSRIGSA